MRLITGDSGIGRAVAVLFAREGAGVAIQHLPEEHADDEQTRAAIESEGRCALLIPGPQPQIAIDAPLQLTGSFECSH